MWERGLLPHNTLLRQRARALQHLLVVVPGRRVIWVGCLPAPSPRLHVCVGAQALGSSVPLQIETQLAETEAQMASLGREGEEAVKQYLKLRTQVRGLARKSGC